MVECVICLLDHETPYYDINMDYRYDNGLGVYVTPLEDAVRYSVIRTVDALLQRGADVTVTALFISIKEATENVDTHRVYKLLLSNISGINIRDRNGNTILHYIARCPNLHMMSILHADGADMNARNTFGQTPLIEACNFQVIEFLLLNGTDPRICSNSGESPIFNAILKGVEAVDLMLEYGVDINGQFTYGDTHGDPHWICDNGVDPYLQMTYGNTHGVTALMRACKDNQEVAVHLLKHRASVDQRDSNGQTALHYAAHKNSIAIRHLLEEGADPNVYDNAGDTPLHYVRNVVLARSLLQNMGNHSDMNVRNSKGRTLLHDVSTLKQAQFLVFSGADINIKDNDGITPLHNVTDFHIAKLFVDNGADINAIDKRGYTPLHVCKSANIMKMLLGNGGNPLIRGIDNATPLHYAVNARVARMLVNRGVDVNAIMNNGNTPLHTLKNISAVKFLINHNANLFITNNDGKTAAMIAKEEKKDSKIYGEIIYNMRHPHGL